MPPSSADHFWDCFAVDAISPMSNYPSHPLADFKPTSINGACHHLYMSAASCMKMLMTFEVSLLQNLAHMHLTREESMIFPTTVDDDEKIRTDPFKE